MPNLQELDPLQRIRDYANESKRLSDGIMQLVTRMMVGETSGEAMAEHISDTVEFLRFFIDAAPILAVELLPNVNDPIMVRTTKALETILGYAPGELNGQPISIIIPPDKRPIHGQHILGFLEHPTDRQMGANVRPEGFTRDGRRFPIVVTWQRFFVERRQFLAATVMPQLEDERISELNEEIRVLKSHQLGN
jgi:PAS domain S-box-containing protein